MTNPAPSLGNPALDALAAFLESPDLDDGVMMLPELDGFLTAIAAGPEPIEPEEWLPVIWGETAPQFADDDEAKTILGAIMARLDEIQATVADGRYAPIFWIGEDGAPMPQGWAVGFMTGAGLRVDAWRPLLESEDDDYLVYPIVAFCEDEDGKPLLELSARDRKHLAANAPDLIGQAVLDVADYWQQKNKPPPEGAIPVRTTPKIGRNDPCPCGSGKKYKKCCGASSE
jgi:uncharacterized protein